MCPDKFVCYPLIEIFRKASLFFNFHYPTVYLLFVYPETYFLFTPNYRNILFVYLVTTLLYCSITDVSC